MSQPSSQHHPMISDCYDELMGDPLLLQSFSEDEWMCTHGLPYLHALCFSIVLEKFFTQLTSQVIWEKARSDFITNTSQRAMSIEITPLAIMVTDGVGERKFGMIKTFCRSYQGKVEPSDVLSTLVQWDSPEPGVVVVKVFTNLPDLPWGSIGSLTWAWPPFQQAP